ncbi:hypothetical protein H2248_012448 [Termitomyces sp. 'cryptogamus']|nr:hypothetical protein H2248_012448 [Termitomyces sp. 'cryptogamus']
MSDLHDTHNRGGATLTSFLRKHPPSHHEKGTYTVTQPEAHPAFTRHPAFPSRPRATAASHHIPWLTWRERGGGSRERWVGTD